MPSQKPGAEEVIEDGTIGSLVVETTKVALADVASTFISGVLEARAIIGSGRAMFLWVGFGIEIAIHAPFISLELAGHDGMTTQAFFAAFIS